MYIEVNGIPWCDATPLTPTEMDKIHTQLGLYPTCSGKDPHKDAEAVRAMRPDLDVKVIDAPCPSYNSNDENDWRD